MKIKFLTLAAFALLLSSCEKKDDDNTTNTDPKVDTQAPEITFISPDDATEYKSGMRMPIKFTVTENDELHEIHLTVTNKTENSTLMHMHMHRHDQTVTIDTAIVIPAVHHTDIEVKAEASDHSGNTSEKSITKHIHM